MPYEQYVAVKRAHWPAILRIIVHDMVGHVEIGKPCHHEAAAAYAKCTQSNPNTLPF